MNIPGNREPLGTTLSDLWEDILYKSGGFRFFRWVLMLVLLGGTVWSVFLFHQMLDMMRPRETRLPPAKSQVESETERLTGEVAAFRSAVLAREGSNQLAVMASRIDRRPFAPGSLPVDEEAERVAAEAAKKKAPGEEQVFAAREEVLPPFMAVQAVMVMGTKKMAVMDIEGESSGMIVRVGTKFGGGLGRVESVSPEAVVVTWADKRIQIPVGM